MYYIYVIHIQYEMLYTLHIIIYGTTYGIHITYICVITFYVICITYICYSMLYIYV